jgi:hypothetical protein
MYPQVLKNLLLFTKLPRKRFSSFLTYVVQCNMYVAVLKGTKSTIKLQCTSDRLRSQLYIKIVDGITVVHQNRERNPGAAFSTI